MNDRTEPTQPAESGGPAGPAEPAEPREPAESGGPGGPEPLPPDPVAYDDPRAELARARGLSAPYIPGGRDPEPDEGLREERFYGRLLLVMVIAILGATFVLTIVAIALGGFAYSGR